MSTLWALEGPDLGKPVIESIGKPRWWLWLLAFWWSARDGHTYRVMRVRGWQCDA